MLQAAATLPRFPEPRRWVMPRRRYTFSLLAGLLAIGLLGAATGLVGRAWRSEHEARASTQRAVAALEQDGFHVATLNDSWVSAQGSGRLSAHSIEAMLHAQRVQSFTIEHPGPRSLPLDRLGKTFDVQHSDGHWYFSRSAKREGWWP